MLGRPYLMFRAIPFIGPSLSFRIFSFGLISDRDSRIGL